MLLFQLSRLDKTLIILALLGALASLWSMNNEKGIRNVLDLEVSGNQVIGQIMKVKDDARRRLKASPVWYTVEEDEYLYADDSLFTGNNSELEFALDSNKNKITLSPNSLVVLTQLDEQLSLDLQIGSVSAKLAKGKEVKVNQNGQVAIISAAEDANISIRASGKAGSLNVRTFSGAVKVKSRQETLNLKPREIIKINKDEKLEKTLQVIELTLPGRNETLWQKKGEPIKFAWKDNKKSDSYLFEVSSTVDFKEIIDAKEVKTTTLESSKLSFDRNYFWRVTSGKIKSEPESFYFREIRGPKLYYPNFEQEFVGEDIYVSFTWEKIIEATDYNLQISKSENFTETFKDLMLKTTEIRNISFPVGEYFWRVKVNNVKELEGVWSKISKFVVKDKNETPLLLLTDASSESNVANNAEARSLVEKTEQSVEKSEVSAPEIPEKVKALTLEFEDKTLANNSSGALVKNPPLLKWTQVSKNLSYEIELSRSSKFNKILVNKIVKRRPQWLWKKVKPGQYFWRVRAYDKDNNRSSFSNAGQLIVKLPPPNLNKVEKSEFNYKILDEFKNSKPNVILSWNSIPYSKKYQIEIIDTASEKSVYKTSEVNRYPIFFKQSGKYKYRVRTMASNEKPLGEYSNWQDINYRKNLILSVPKVNLPGNGTTIVSFGENSNEPIVFDWNKVKHATTYVLQMSNDKDFNNVILEERIKNNNFILNSPEKGETFWRVRAEYEEFKSGWTLPYSFSLVEQKQ